MAVLGQNLPPPPPFLFAISVRGAKSGFYLFIYTPIVQVASSCEKQQRTLFLTAMLFDYSSIRLGVALGSADWQNRFPDLASNLLEIKEVESPARRECSKGLDKAGIQLCFSLSTKKVSFPLNGYYQKCENLSKNIFLLLILFSMLLKTVGL